MSSYVWQYQEGETGSTREKQTQCCTIKVMLAERSRGSVLRTSSAEIARQIRT